MIRAKDDYNTKRPEKTPKFILNPGFYITVYRTPKLKVTTTSLIEQSLELDGQSTSEAGLAIRICSLTSKNSNVLTPPLESKTTHVYVALFQEP